MANTNDSTEKQSPSKVSRGSDPYGAEPGSILSKLSEDPELYKRYREWLREIRDDSEAIEQWARNGFQSLPEFDDDDS